MASAFATTFIECDQPLQKLDTLFVRLADGKTVLEDIADIMKDLTKVEDLYVKEMQRILQKRQVASQRSLGLLKPSWDRVWCAIQDNVELRTGLARDITTNVESVLRASAAKDEFKDLKKHEKNLTKLATTFLETKAKHDKLLAMPKRSKADDLKLKETQAKLQKREQEWKSSAATTLVPLHDFELARVRTLQSCLQAYTQSIVTAAGKQTAICQEVNERLAAFKPESEMAYICDTGGGVDKTAVAPTLSGAKPAADGDGIASKAGASRTPSFSVKRASSLLSVKRTQSKGGLDGAPAQAQVGSTADNASAAPVVDEEGFSVRPTEAEHMNELKQATGNDSDSDGEHGDQETSTAFSAKLKIEIKNEAVGAAGGDANSLAAAMSSLAGVLPAGGGASLSRPRTRQKSFMSDASSIRAPVIPGMPAQTSVGGHDTSRASRAMSFSSGSTSHTAPSISPASFHPSMLMPTPVPERASTASMPLVTTHLGAPTSGANMNSNSTDLFDMLSPGAGNMPVLAPIPMASPVRIRQDVANAAPAILRLVEDPPIVTSASPPPIPSPSPAFSSGSLPRVTTNSATSVAVRLPAVSLQFQNTESISAYVSGQGSAVDSLQITGETSLVVTSADPAGPDSAIDPTSPPSTPSQEPRPVTFKISPRHASLLLTDVQPCPDLPPSVHKMAASERCFDLDLAALASSLTPDAKPWPLVKYTLFLSPDHSTALHCLPVLMQVFAKSTSADNLKFVLKYHANPHFFTQPAAPAASLGELRIIVRLPTPLAELELTNNANYAISPDNRFIMWTVPDIDLSSSSSGVGPENGLTVTGSVKFPPSDTATATEHSQLVVSVRYKITGTGVGAVRYHPATSATTAPKITHVDTVSNGSYIFSAQHV
ncbi:hypothetical protein RI367_003349 [Sorochytrium milnesiophthora]